MPNIRIEMEGQDEIIRDMTRTYEELLDEGTVKSLSLYWKVAK